MAKKGSKSTPQEAEAGRQNLLDWKGNHPEGGHLKHGRYSGTVRQRYSDKRTSEGRQLKAIIDSLMDDLGGHESITAAQRLILDNIKSKLIVILQIGKYVDQQPSIINSVGELIPCLSRNYTAYAEGLRRDLESLFGYKRKPNHQSYEKVVKSLEGGHR